MKNYSSQEVVEFIGNNLDSVLTRFAWIEDGIAKVQIHGETKMLGDGKIEFKVNSEFETEKDRTTYSACHKTIQKAIAKRFKDEINSFLSEYCTKVRKNESEATTERMLIDHRCITVKGKEYYIPRSYTHDEEQSVIQNYLYDNFQI